MDRAKAGDREPPTAGCLAVSKAALNDPEDDHVPEGLPSIIDAHVHLFPDPLFQGIWRWFDEHGWPIRYQRPAGELARFLLERGVEQVILMPYAHRPGMARELNAFVASVCRADPRMVGLATVVPGEPEIPAILDEAFALGLRGVKLHCHVQCFSPDDSSVDPIYQACVAHDLAVVIHAGREPKSPAYRCDPHQLCSAARVQRVLDNFPQLKLCVPHLGFDEHHDYEQMLLRHDNLWLDTAMALARFFEDSIPERLLHVRPDRILYGSDFPNIPYAWDRELKHLAALGLDDDTLSSLLAGNARQLFGI